MYITVNLVSVLYVLNMHITGHTYITVNLVSVLYILNMYITRHTVHHYNIHYCKSCISIIHAKHVHNRTYIIVNLKSIMFNYFHSSISHK